MAPIAASSQSRSKLKAFQFHEDEEPREDQDSFRNNDIGKENKSPKDDQRSPSQMNPPLLPSSQKSAGKELRDCPQTPIGRLPLSELLANGDDARQNLAYTPKERVLWENSPMIAGLSNSIPAKKKRKRAHSASPSSSSQNEASAHFAGRKTKKDSETSQQALKTPKADPADDLWSRYSLNTNGRSPSAPGALPFSHLIHSSSPQTPASHLQNRDSGLRRAFSCIEWPTSASKRRKMHHHESKTEVATRFPEPAESALKSKMSRVSILVEKIHDGLSKQRRTRDFCSSEPEEMVLTAPRGVSPAQGIVSSHHSSDAMDDVVTVMSQTAMADKLHTKHLVLSEEEILDLSEAADSSDFGDDDLDLHLFDTAVTSKSEGISTTDNQPKKAASPTPKHKERAEIKEPCKTMVPRDLTGTLLQKSMSPVYKNASPEKSTCSLGPKTSSRGNSHRDEFDEDSSDVSAADLEDMFAKYDTQETPPQVAKDGHCEPQKASKEYTARASRAVASQTSAAIEVEVLSSDDEDFGDDSDFEQIAAECAEATQEQRDGAPAQSFDDRKPLILQRYLIKAVAESEQDIGSGRLQAEKILSVQCETAKLCKIIILRQAWLDSPCTPGSYVHLIGTFDRYGQCVVDNTQNLLIINPDHLISSTVVGDSFTCIRKAVLQDRVKATSDANQATVYGHMLHEIFQEAMRVNRWDNVFMTTTIDAIATRYLETLFEINVEHEMAVEQLMARAMDLQTWAEIFVAAKPKPNAVIKDRNGAQALMSINKLLEVEEHVWSPLYGLKGNIDATVQIQLNEAECEKTLTVPFELKTGKHSSAAHKAQTSLYSLLLSDRYDVNIACGILYYMQTSEISTIRTLRHELVPMVIQRNELASFVRKRTRLPPMLRKPYTCGKCYARTPCFLYHKLVDDGNGETSGMGEKFEDLVKHLKLDHQHFFSKWDDLLTKEEKDIVRFRRELWTMQSGDRESLGRCFGGLVIEPASFHEENDAPKIHRFRYGFVKNKPGSGFTFTESQITLGEPIVISDEEGHFALANGYVTKVRKHKIEVTVDRRLHNSRARKKNFDPERNQVFSGIMEVIQDSSGNSTQTPSQPNAPVLYRLDKDEFSNGMALVRNNLIRLMEKDVFGVQALRRLIVEGMAPTFKPTPSNYTLGDMASQATLNIDQKAAIEKVMSAKDYALVLGMPGTGKTTTIAHIIRALVAQGKSVLLTSYTHTAVDNILLKLRDDGIGIFRLGAIAKIHPEVEEFADLAGKSVKTVEELKECYTRKVVATTCLGINHPIFNQRIFDYCIVDEASQITLPVCLGPIRMARTFILVGDHYQLPPLVQNKEAIEGGLDISLFKLLSDKHPSSVVNLEHQYRMCEDIMTLSNTLIYHGRLKCGTQSVANRSITIPNIEALKQHHHTAQRIASGAGRRVCAGPWRSTCWLRDLLDPSIKACFVNTDPLLPSAREVLESGSRIINPCEATLATQLVESLITTGIAPTDIGVITLYRSQLALLKQSLRHRSGVEMHTADKFQGRDKEVVILSLVRSNEQQIVGDLLKDWRRVNVALTRARTKLLVLGSKRTLSGNELLRDFVVLMEGRGWLYDLPPSACEGHIFEEVGTQFSSGKGTAEPKTEQASVYKAAIGKGLGSASGKENGAGRKLPAKQGKLDVKALMGRRPVLRDIVNDAS